MHHGYGNLEKAINELDAENRKEFLDYVKTNDSFNPHIMFISKAKIINDWFDLFGWLDRCENISNLILYKIMILEDFLHF